MSRIRGCGSRSDNYGKNIQICILFSNNCFLYCIGWSIFVNYKNSIYILPRDKLDGYINDAKYQLR